MIDIPLNIIIKRIKESTGLGEEEINNKIKEKLKDLSGLISEEGAAHIVANELGVKLLEAIEGEMTIENILPGMRNLQVKGKVRQAYETREFNTGGRAGKVGSFLMQDETGIIRVVLWNEHADKIKELKTGDVVRIKGAYSKSNNNRKEIHLGDTSTIEINPEGIEVNVEIDKTPDVQRKKIAEIKPEDENVEVIATIVQVFDPRFFPSRQNPEETNYVMNLYLDDGSDNIRCVLWSEQIERILGKTRQEILEMKEKPGSFEEIKNELLGQIIKVRGRIKNNEVFGRLELIANNIKKDLNPEEEITNEETEETNKEENEQEPESQSPEEQEERNDTKRIITEETKIQAEMNEEGEVESIKREEEIEETKKYSESEDDLLTLDDIEDLEELDE